MKILLKIGKWVLIVFVAAFAVFFVWRMFVTGEVEKTAKQVERIHNSEITMNDVLGKNLPPAPNNPDATVEGIDANKNGIRDDVELAIFAKYLNSAKTRSALLQYAHALQMEVTQPFVNTEIVIAVAQERSRASKCIGQSYPRTNLNEFIKVTEEYSNFVTKKQINTKTRDETQKKFYEKIGSYASLESSCDIDISTLSN